jgi:tRNA threonylcarbamoyladenosine biosynthesis protein TsaB
VSRILAIDTTGVQGSIALLDDAHLVEEAGLVSPDGFAHVLFGEIERLLDRHRLAPGDIDVYAAASGPGSFTGVRVGLTAAKGLAEATGRRVAAVSNLRALATYSASPLRATVIDARRGEIYGAVYNSALELVQDEVVINFDAWLAGLPAGVEFVTSGFPLSQTPRIEAPPWLASAIGKVVVMHPELAGDPAAAEANYVRRSDAELFWKD